MHIFWHDPFPHQVYNPLALACLRPGDRLTVQALRTSRGRPLRTDFTRYEILRDLPEAPPRNLAGWRRIPLRVATPARRVQARRRALRRLRPDVCHLMSVNYLIDGFDLPTIGKRTPLVTTVHDVRPHRRRVTPPLETVLLRRLYRNAGHLVVLHESLREELVSDFGIARDRVWVIPHPIEPVADLTPATVDPWLVLFFGTLRPNKGIPILLDAAAQLASASNARFHVAGGGDAELEQLVADAARRLPNLTADIGPVSAERMDELFRSARIVVLPYTSLHSQSGVLANAYAYAIPLVVTDVGAIGHTVRDDHTGLVVPLGDPDALAEAVIHLLENEQQLHGFTAAVAAAVPRYSNAVTGQRLRDIYDVATLESSS